MLPYLVTIIKIDALTEETADALIIFGKSEISGRLSSHGINTSTKSIVALNFAKVSSVRFTANVGCRHLQSQTVNIGD